MDSIRPAVASDSDAIRRVHCAAFPSAAEADLVDALRRAQAVCASLVGLAEDGAVVGHALFSYASLELPREVLRVAALGPVAVRPEWQRRGVGAELIRAGPLRCWEPQLPAVILLGHATSYPRFGSRRADTWSIRCGYDVPPEAFMIAWSDAPRSGPGLAKYHPAFGAV